MNLSAPLSLFLIIVATIAVIALLIFLIVFLVKPSAGRDSFRLAIPLNLQARKKKKHHVFLGLSEHSKLMAAQILQEWKQEKNKKNHGQIIIVDLAPAFSKIAERRLQEELGSTQVTVLSSTPAKPDEKSLAAAIGLDGLQPWLANPHTHLYLFSEQKPENVLLLSLAASDDSIQAKVFYYSPEPGGVEALVAATGARVRMLNPHQMAFMQLKLNCPQLMPVHYVQKAENADGMPLGYVEEGLHALVIGFGNTGQEAVRFLYEYGSFVGKNYLCAPMSVSVYDPDLENMLGAFLQSAPALKGDPAFHWHAERAGSVPFWDAFAEDPHVHYIIIAMDEGPRNIEMGVALLKEAARSGRNLSKMAILIRNWKDNWKTGEILDFYNTAYCPEGIKVLHSFGNTRDIWNSDVISGRKLKKTARLFYENLAALGTNESWEERKERLSKPGPDQLKNQMELRRRQAMDISRAIYAPTLLAFVPEGEPDASLMQYLLAQEHLHWMNALAVTGYCNGPLDELLQRHPNMVPYPEIKSYKTRDIGLLAVKSMLKLRSEHGIPGGQ